MEAVLRYKSDIENGQIESNSEYETFIRDIFNHDEADGNNNKKEAGLKIDVQKLVWVNHLFIEVLKELAIAGKQKKLCRGTLNKLIFSQDSILQQVENLKFTDNHEYCNLHQIGPNSYSNNCDSGFQFIPAFRSHDSPSLFETVQKTQFQVFMKKLNRVLFIQPSESLISFYWTFCFKNQYNGRFIL